MGKGTLLFFIKQKYAICTVFGCQFVHIAISEKSVSEILTMMPEYAIIIVPKGSSSLANVAVACIVITAFIARCKRINMINKTFSVCRKSFLFIRATAFSYALRF